MKKIVKLTEKDLTNLVKRVLKEQEDWYFTDDERESVKGAGGKFDIDKFDELMDKKASTRPIPTKKKEGKGPFASAAGESWYDKEDRMVSEPFDYSEEKTFGPDEYDDFMEYINDCNTKWCLQTKKFYDIYASKGAIKVRK